MKPKLAWLVLLLHACIYVFSSTPSLAQDSIKVTLEQIPSRYFDKVAKTTGALNEQLSKRSQKVLARLQQKELQLQKQLYRLDSLGAVQFFSEAKAKYQKLLNGLQQKSNSLQGHSGEYLPYMDSLRGSLAFLEKYKNLFPALKSEKLDGALKQLNEFEYGMQQAEAIKQFIKERKEGLMSILSRYTSLPKSLGRKLSQYQREVYYYSQQLRDYKENFRDPVKMQRTALMILNQLPAFRDFMKEHSHLAGLFGIPLDYVNAGNLAGFQTRTQVQQSITSQMGGASNIGQVFSQQIQSAQDELNKFKEKLTALGGGSGDIEMPDFKPNSMRTKTFLQHLEYGTNIQSTRAGYFFPSATEIALTVGYRINEKSVAGFGVSGRIGWGKDFRHIAVTGQGIGLRSFIDVKIKKSFYGSGGFEYNYQQPFSETQQLHAIENWQKSGLIGITKIISIKSKLFKKTKVQLLWDFLTYYQRPRVGQPIKFRVGYNF